MTGGAARLWWLLRHFGHEQVAVLDGGIGAWRGALSEGDEEVGGASFEPRERQGDTIEADEIAERLGDGHLLLLDARSEERYRGAPGIDAVGGRIPGATNLPFTEASSIPADVLAAEDIVVYCGSGITACVDLLALEHAGRGDAKLYPGSWSEWIQLDLPIERD
jgi:thiosulfate/3-mercaptopyruvate sulfurtransferase